MDDELQAIRAIYTENEFKTVQQGTSYIKSINKNDQGMIILGTRTQTYI